MNTQVNKTKPNDINLLIMRTAVEQSASAVVITDAKGIIEYANPKFIELTGYSAEELIGHNPKKLQAGNTSEKQYKDMWQSLSEKGQWQGEIKNKNKKVKLIGLMNVLVWLKINQEKSPII